MNGPHISFFVGRKTNVKTLANHIVLCKVIGLDIFLFTSFALYGIAGCVTHFMVPGVHEQKFLGIYIFDLPLNFTTIKIIRISSMMLIHIHNICEVVAFISIVFLRIDIGLSVQM